MLESTQGKMRGQKQTRTDSVVTTSVVVGSIFLSTDELFRVEELAVRSSPDLVNDGRLKIDENCTGNVLAGTLIIREINYQATAIIEALSK
jgi:hypothetical protein